MSLTGKTALITGSSRGIGKAIALEFAKQGCNIIINYSHNEEVAKKTEEEIKQLGVKTYLVKADVSDYDNVKEMMNAVIEHFGKIDILVNNAAVPFQKKMMDIEWEDWDLIQNVNIKGTFFVLQEAARNMIEEGKGGSIVNISSLAGEGGRPLFIPYGASKAAVINMTQSAAKELAKYNIRVNSVSPGTIETQMLKDCFKNVAVLEKKDIYPYQTADLLVLGEQCSMTVRRADGATRDVVAWLKCEYLLVRVGEEFDGVVSAVTGFGLFVDFVGESGIVAQVIIVKWERFHAFVNR